MSSSVTAEASNGAHRITSPSAPSANQSATAAGGDGPNDGTNPSSQQQTAPPTAGGGTFFGGGNYFGPANGGGLSHGYSMGYGLIDRLALQQPAPLGSGYFSRWAADMRGANNIIPGLMAPPGLGLALGAGETFGNLLQLPTFGSIGSAMGTAGIEGGLGAAIAGGEMDAIVAAGVEAAGAALAEVGLAGVAGAAYVFGIGTLVVGAAFEAGMGIGFGAIEAGQSLADFGVSLFTR